MNQISYIGHPSQLCGVEEHRLVGGRGDGMRLLQVRNGKGLEFTVSADRCADISRLSFKGDNYGFFSACGYAAPAYYDDKDAGWLKNFTAGFLTTCGLDAVGSPCEDQGESLPLHGRISNTPAEHLLWDEDDTSIWIKAVMNHARIFERKLMLTRVITCSKQTNEITICDTVENIGDAESPLMLLYHMNMGYPLLDEDSEVTIPSVEVRARDDHAQEDIANWMHMEKPQGDYQERCYYHKFEGADGKAGIYQPKLNVGLEISFDASKLDGFVEWKMMGVRDYVLGLECGNCYPDGRDVMRKTGMLKFLKPGEAVDYHVDIKLYQK